MTFTLTLTPGTGGSLSASPLGPTYQAGTVVTITATPDANDVFGAWTVDGVAAGSANPLTLTMDAVHTVAATFIPATQRFALALTTTGGGSVAVSPPGPSYGAGTHVTLTATPADGFTFGGWLIGGVAVGWGTPLTITMSANYAVHATFLVTPRWTAWAAQGGMLTDTPAATTGPGGRVYVFARGSDNALYVTSRVDGLAFTGWTRLGGVLTGPPIATSAGGILYVFARGSDNALYLTSSADGATWTGWTRLGGVLTTAPAATAVGGTLYVFAKGSDDALFVTSSTDGATFTPWRNLGGVLTAAPAATVFQGQVYVFARGSDEGLYEQHSADGVAFTGWKSLGGALTAAPAAASYTPDGGAETLLVFATGTDGALYERYTGDGLNYTPWVGLGGRLTGSPAVAGGNGRLFAFARGSDNALWSRGTLR